MNSVLFARQKNGPMPVTNPSPNVVCISRKARISYTIDANVPDHKHKK